MGAGKLRGLDMIPLSGHKKHINAKQWRGESRVINGDAAGVKRHGEREIDGWLAGWMDR